LLCNKNNKLLIIDSLSLDYFEIKFRQLDSGKT